MPTGVPRAEYWGDREPPPPPPTAAVTGSDSVARLRAGPGSDMLVDLFTKWAYRGRRGDFF